MFVTKIARTLVNRPHPRGSKVSHSHYAKGRWFGNVFRHRHIVVFISQVGFKPHVAIGFGRYARFFIGLTQDLTKKVGVWTRLGATFASGILACWLTGISLNRLDVYGVDWLLA